MIWGIIVVWSFITLTIRAIRDVPLNQVDLLHGALVAAGLVMYWGML